MTPRLIVSLLVAGEFSVGGAEFRFGEQRLTVPDGFVVERVAGPPLVDRPITASFDNDGALYVADSSGSNSKPEVQVANPTHRIVKLVDRDRDGIFDDQTVFADRLSFPEGTLWLGGSLYVSAPPQIWKFTDVDHDGVAEKREVWFDGKTLTGCANDLHGPYAGLDGYIYWCKGAFAEQRHTLGNGREFVSRASHVFRARPDGSDFDVVFTAGMDNPVDVVFARSGDMFVSGTFLVNPADGKRDGIVHAVHGGVWGKEHSALDGHPRTGDLMPIMIQRGPAAAAGLEMIRSETCGFRDDLLCAEFNLRKISRHALVPDGATFEAKSSDFLVSDQMDFHPTDVLEDADGSILVVDTGGWYKLCCPTSTLAKPEVLGAIYRVRKADAPKIENARGQEKDWSKVDPAWLADSRPLVVERTIAALGEKVVTETIVPILKKAAEPRTRVNAIWALTRMQGDEARAAVRIGLEDEGSVVRTAATHSVALWRDYAAFYALLVQLKDPNDHLRRAAAMALGRIGDRRAVGPLLDAAQRQNDRFMQHAITYALYEIGDDASLPPDESSGVARTVRKMRVTSARAKSQPTIAPPKPAAPAVVDPAVLAQQRARLEVLSAQLPKGVVARGETLFRDARSMCTLCHAMAGQGGSLGPDLTKIGAIRTERDLLESLVYPSASLVRSYEPVIVRTAKGEQAGLVRKDAADEIILGVAPGAEVHIPRSEVLETQYGSTSLMPQGFDGMLSPQDLADLIAFLRTAR